MPNLKPKCIQFVPKVVDPIVLPMSGHATTAGNLIPQASQGTSASKQASPSTTVPLPQDSQAMPIEQASPPTPVPLGSEPEAINGD